MYKAQKEKATEDAICQYTYAGIGVALSMATGNPFVGAAFMSYIQFQGVATGDMSVQHWAVQTGMQLAASAAGGYVEGVTSSGVYGTLASGGVQSLGNFVEYKADGGLGLQWGSKEQWRSSGIGTLTAMVGATINAQSSIAALTRYGYTMGSSYIVNRFDGRGSWQDDMLQAGASTLAMIASSALLSDGTDIGKFVGSRNSTLVMQRFMQGTFENMLLATGGMWIGSNKGQSFGDILLSQNWQKTQYTLSDYAAAKLSEYCKDRGKDHAEKARKAMEDMDRKEGILGLAWLGLRKVESVLGSAVDGIIQWIDQNVQDEVRGVLNTGQRVVNWLKDGKWVTNEEKLQIAVEAALKEFEQMMAVAVVAVEAAMAEYARRAKEAILKSFYNDTREKTDAKIYALKAAGVDTADIEAEVARLRKQLEERKQKEQAEAQKKAEQVKEAGELSWVEKFYKYNITGTYNRREYLSKLEKHAEEAVDAPDVKEGYTNKYGTTGTWCNLLLHRLLNLVGVEHDMMLSTDPDGKKKNIDWTTANHMAKNLENAAKEIIIIRRVKETTDGKQAQEWANKGYAVVAAWYNHGGSGHVALVIPDNNKYDDDKGPKIVQAGKDNIGPSDKDGYVKKGFGVDWKIEDKDKGKERVKFYLIK